MRSLRFRHMLAIIVSLALTLGLAASYGNADNGCRGHTHGTTGDT